MFVFRKEVGTFFVPIKVVPQVLHLSLYEDRCFLSFKNIFIKEKF